MYEASPHQRLLSLLPMVHYYYNSVMHSLLRVSLHTQLPQQCGRVETELKARQLWFQIESQPLTGCLTLGKLYLHPQAHCLKWEKFCRKDQRWYYFGHT